MKLNKLHYTVEDGIAVVQLDYPKNLNAIDEEMADELLYVVQAAEADESVKVVVFKGLPRAFRPAAISATSTSSSRPAAMSIWTALSARSARSRMA